MFEGGSSINLSNALIEFKFKNSILSMRTNLGFSLKEDLLRFEIISLIWLISIDFFSLFISINIKFGFDLFNIVLNEEFSGFINKFFGSYLKSSFLDKI